METENDFTTVDQIDATPALPALDATWAATLSSESHLILLLGLLNGTLLVVDGAIVKNEPRTTGPRGELPRVAARREQARVAIYEAAANGPFTVNDLVTATGLTYYDIQYVARREQVAGRLIETKNGRKCTFALPGSEE